MGEQEPDRVAATSTVDAAIRDFFNGEPGSDIRLAATGAAGLHRALDLFHGRDAVPSSWRKTLPPVRDRGDSWVEALSICARAAPSVYVDSLGTRRLSVVEIAILGGIADARAITLLCSCLRDPDELRRYNAVRALARHSDAAALAGIEEALSDPAIGVRFAAVEAVGDRDPARAVPLYEQLLADPSVTPPIATLARLALREHSALAGETRTETQGPDATW